MKILCFGDSNTYGYNPENGLRYEKNERWSGILQEILCEDLIIEEGLNGRTTIFDDPIAGDRVGIDALIPSIKEFSPIDLIIIMLGTNDVKEKFNATPEDINNGIEMLIQKVNINNKLFSNNNANILIVAPVPLAKGICSMTFVGEMGEIAYQNSKKLADLYEQTAQKYKCHFIDAGNYAKCSESDFVHLGKEAHRNIANAVANKISEII